MSKTTKKDTKKVETKKEEPKKVEKKVEAPKKEEKKVEAPKKEEKKVEAPKKEEKKVETKKEEKKVETKKEEKKEAPKKVEKKEAPKKEEKKEEAPKTEEPKQAKKEDLKKEVLKPKRKGEKAKKKVVKRFTIDCGVPVKDGILDLDNFHEFLISKWKIDGKTGLVGQTSTKVPRVVIIKEHESIKVTAETQVAKKYLKYLTKKYLKKNELLNWLHIVGVDKTTYHLKYIPIAQEEEQEPEVEEKTN